MLFFAKGQKKTVEIPAVPCREGAARFCNSRLQQGDSSFAMSQSSGRNKGDFVMTKSISEKCRASFDLGQVVATPGALEATTNSQRLDYLRRHSIGDWGVICREDAASNDVAVEDSPGSFRPIRSIPPNRARAMAKNLMTWMRSRFAPIGSLSAATRKLGDLPLGALLKSPPIGSTGCRQEFGSDRAPCPVHVMGLMRLGEGDRGREFHRLTRRAATLTAHTPSRAYLNTRSILTSDCMAMWGLTTFVHSILMGRPKSIHKLRKKQFGGTTKLVESEIRATSSDD
jgi:hypothetical protein